MKILSSFRALLLLYSGAFALHGEILSLNITISGMDCASCVTGLETKLKRMRGVQSAELKPEKNLAILQLSQGNTIRLERIRDEIKGVGFTPKEAVISALGRASQDQGIWSFTVEGTNQKFLLSPLEPGIARHLNPGKLIRIEALQSTPAPSMEPTLELKSLSAVPSSVL